MLKKYILKKALVCGIILLFIGAGVIPSISGNIGKMSIQSTNEVPTNFPLNNDYVNAYWKFDECSGSILEDSSGHDFDGTIYGASWTGGYSGCALDFDGVDDYVDLDAHSVGLGFNKTDDLIFSVYFKSTSTESGMIYCLAGTNHVPEARIELVSNGSLSFKVWTNVCGVLVYSDDSFNDDSWHHAEIFFNGITANPTVTMYVDNTPEGITTAWLCDIENTDFNKAKIGRRGYESEAYFDGKIDELKIIKYPGGNEQEPPTISGPTSGDPGVEYDFTFVTNDPEQDNISLHIVWGDGNETDWIGPYESGAEVKVSYAWEEEGEYEIKAESKDIWDDSYWSDPYPVWIGNQPPDAPTIDGPKSGDVDEELTYTFVAEDLEEDDVKYFINWDDGDTEETGYHESGEVVTVSHAWNSAGDYEITARAKDEHGAEGDWSDPYLIRIGNQPPDKPDIGGPSSGVPGVEYDFTFVTTDPEGDDVYYDIKWGDGDSLTDHGPWDSGEVVTVSHTWENEGTVTIEARARDTFDAYSDWSRYTFTVPRNRAFSFNLLELLFVNGFHIHAFSIIKYPLNYLV